MKRVLVVEDDAAVADFIAQLLRSRGHQVRMGRNGDEGAALCADASWPPDVLLCDVIMPGLPCSDVVRVALDLHPGLKVLLMTGWADDAVRDGMPEGLCVLQKPFTVARLLGCMTCAESENACEGKKIAPVGTRAPADLGQAAS